MNILTTGVSGGRAPAAEVTAASALEVVKLNQTVAPILVNGCKADRSAFNLPPAIADRLALVDEAELQSLASIRFPIIGFSNLIADQILYADSQVEIGQGTHSGLALPPELVLQALITFASVARATSLAPLWLRLPGHVLSQIASSSVAEFYQAARKATCTFNIPAELLDDVLAGGHLASFAVARLCAMRPDLH